MQPFSLVFAQVTSDLAMGTGLPDWLPPVLVTNLALALLVILANGRGVWISGREHIAIVKAKDEQLTKLEEGHKADLKEMGDRHSAEIIRFEALRKEERDGRLQAEGRLGRSVEQMNRLAAQLTEIERKVSGAATPAQGQGD